MFNENDLLLVSDVMTFSINDIKSVLTDEQLRNLVDLVKLEQTLIDDDEEYNSIEDDLVHYYYLIKNAID